MASTKQTGKKGVTRLPKAPATLLPEDRAKLEDHRARLTSAWIPQDEMEESLVEQIAVAHCQLGHLDRYEASIHEKLKEKPTDAVAAMYRLSQTRSRLRQGVSAAIADLERYRKSRLERRRETDKKESASFQPGLIWNAGGRRSYSVLPRVLGLDGVWREIPRGLLGDTSQESKLAP